MTAATPGRGTVHGLDLDFVSIDKTIAISDGSVLRFLV
jgi:hypothetical protein